MHKIPKYHSKNHADLAAQLNDALLNTSVDIESEVKGDRLLEFDEKGKNIKKKFEEFINGDLQASFIFSIRDFFVGAFESLGVLGDSAQGFIDQQFEEFLDPALLDEVVNISVKRKAGLGLGGDDPIKEAISDVITASIETIQSIINQLPADLAAQLNETLLNADIDIDSTIKGDKLLEFDETNVVSLNSYGNAEEEYRLAA